MPNKSQNRIEISEKNRELTPCITADLIEKISDNKNAVSVCSKAFDHTAPDGEKLQVQIVVTRDIDLMLSDDQVDMFDYEG